MKATQNFRSCPQAEYRSPDYAQSFGQDLNSATSAPFGATQIVKKWSGLQSPDPIRLDIFRKVDSLTDLWADAKGNGATTGVSLDYDVIMIKEDPDPVLLTV